VSKASADLLFKELKVTKEEILKKYPNYVSQQKSTEVQPHTTSVSANQKFKPVQNATSENNKENLAPKQVRQADGLSISERRNMKAEIKQ
jgi:hypothetical protein